MSQSAKLGWVIIYVRARLDRNPFNVELCLVFNDAPAAFRHAVASGCTPLAEPERKPHGQVTSFVRDPFGTLVEIASPLERPGDPD